MNAVKLLTILAGVGLVASQVPYGQPYMATPAYTYPTYQPNPMIQAPLMDFQGYMPQQVYPEYSGVSLYNQRPQQSFPVARSLSDIDPNSKETPAVPAKDLASEPKATPKLKSHKSVAKKSKSEPQSRSLELQKTKKSSLVSSRKMMDVNIKQKQLLLQFKTFISDLRTHHFASLTQFESYYSNYFQDNQSFFVHNFLHVFEDNFASQGTRNFNFRRIEDQLAKSVIGTNLTGYNSPLNISPSSLSDPSIDFHSPAEIFKFLATLVNEQNDALRAGIRPSNELKLPNELAEKFALLAVLYRAEHLLYRSPSANERAQIIRELSPYNINSYAQFKETISEMAEYFRDLIRYLQSFHSLSNRKPLKEITSSIKEMLRRIKSERLGEFYVDYLKNYRSLRIEGDNPTDHQRQTLKYLTEQLISDSGHEKFLSTVFKILKSEGVLQGINSDRSPKSIVPLEIFAQILENRIKHGSVKFLVVFYFEWVFGLIRNIEDFVFRGFPGLTDQVKFDYKRFLNSLLHDYDHQAFRKFNIALLNLSGQVDAIMENGASDFDKFAQIYAKLLFKILGQYYFVVNVPEFLKFANAYELPRQFYPYNFKLALLRASLNNQNGKPDGNEWSGSKNISPEFSTPSPTKETAIDSKIDDIIANLNKYLDIIKRQQFGSEEERAEILRLVRQVLDSDVPEVLSKTHFKQPEVFQPEAEPQENEPVNQIAPRQDPIPNTLHAKVTITGIPRAKEFHITIRLLDRATTITKILEQLFMYTSKDENSRLMSIIQEIFGHKTYDIALSEKLDHLYEAIDIYTSKLDNFFDDSDQLAIKKFWKILVLFYSKDCHIKLYKLLSDRIAVANSALKNETDLYQKMKGILHNFLAFLINNKKYNFRKECAAVILMILRTKRINAKLIKKALFLHNFRKVLKEHQDKGNRTGDDSIGMEKNLLINRLVKLSLNRNEFGKIRNPSNGPFDIEKPKIEPPFDKEDPSVHDEPPTNVSKQQITFVRKILSQFFKYFKKKNSITDFGKTVFFGIPKEKLNLFKILYKKYKKSPSGQMFESNPKAYLQLQKIMLKTFALPPKTPDQPEQKYIEFVKKILAKPELKQSESSPNKRVRLSKILYKPSPKVLQTFHLLYDKFRNSQAFFRDQNNLSYISNLKKILYKRKVDVKPVVDKSELKFVQKILNNFYKDTPFIDSQDALPRVRARIFLKRLPADKIHYIKRIYNKYPLITQLRKRGPIAELNSLIQKTIIKKQNLAQKPERKPCACKSKCYKIVNGEKTELSDEERKRLIGDFKCGDVDDQGFKWLEGNGEEENKPGYGCACGCSGKGAVQLNDHPVFNLNFDFNSNADIEAFKKALKGNDSIKALTKDNQINMEALKKKYETTGTGRVFDFLFNSLAGGKRSSNVLKGNGQVDPDVNRANNNGPALQPNGQDYTDESQDQDDEVKNSRSPEDLEKDEDLFRFGNTLSEEALIRKQEEELEERRYQAALADRDRLEEIKKKQLEDFEKEKLHRNLQKDPDAKFLADIENKKEDFLKQIAINQLSKGKEPNGFGFSYKDSSKGGYLKSMNQEKQALQNMIKHQIPYFINSGLLEDNVHRDPAKMNAAYVPTMRLVNERLEPGFKVASAGAWENFARANQIPKNSVIYMKGEQRDLKLNEQEQLEANQGHKIVVESNEIV